MSSTLLAPGNPAMPALPDRHEDATNTPVTSTPQKYPPEQSLPNTELPKIMPNSGHPGTSDLRSHPAVYEHPIDPASSSSDSDKLADSLNSKDNPLHRRKPGPSPQIQVRPGVTVCQNCLTTTTPLWRRDENGQIMCNACGLFLKLHGRRRPISLKTDVIKSRNRSNRQNKPGVATIQTPKRRQVQTPMAVSAGPDSKSPSSRSPPQPIQQMQQMQQPPQQGPPPQQVPHPGHPTQAIHAQQALSMGHPGVALSGLPGIASLGAVPLVYPSSPALSPYINGNPQGLILNSPALAPIPGSLLPHSSLSQQPMSPQVMAQTGGLPVPVSQLPGRGAMSEQLLPKSPESTDRIPHLAQVPVEQFQKSQNTHTGSPAEPNSRSTSGSANAQEDHRDQTSTLMTRVSELELVNDLLRSRIQDLEASESAVRKELESLKSTLPRHENDQPMKRIKVSELV